MDDRRKTVKDDSTKQVELEMSKTAKMNFKGSNTEGFYLDIPLDDLPAHQDAPLWQVNSGQGDEGLPNNLITGEPVKAQHHEVKGQLWHSG